MPPFVEAFFLPAAFNKLIFYPVADQKPNNLSASAIQITDKNNQKYLGNVLNKHKNISDLFDTEAKPN
jgi:hypothetical protein